MGDSLCLENIGNLYGESSLLFRKCTEESLDKMLERDHIPIVRDLQSTIAEENNDNNEVLEVMCKLDDNF